MMRTKQHYTDIRVDQAGMIASPIAIPSVDSWEIGAVQGEGMKLLRIQFVFDCVKCQYWHNRAIAKQ